MLIIKVKGQNIRQSDLLSVRNSLPSHDVSACQVWDLQVINYAPDNLKFLRSKVAVIYFQYPILHDLKAYPPVSRYYRSSAVDKVATNGLTDGQIVTPTPFSSKG